VSTEQSLEIKVQDKVQSLAEVENFANRDEHDQDKLGEGQDYRDADSFFNLPDGEAESEKDS
jgi:hypothetical protein